MYGSTCADMQVDVMGECLSSIKAFCRCKISISGKEIARRIAVKITPSCCLSEKWRIINLLDDILDAFTRGRIIGKLEEGRSVTSVASEFGIAHSIVSRLRRQFQTTGTAIRGSVVVVHEVTTPADDRNIVLQARRNRRQTAGEIAYRHSDWTTDIAFYRGQKTARWWSVCTMPCTVCFNACPSEKRSRCGAGNTGTGETMNGDEYSFTDDSRFSLVAILIAYSSGESGEANHPSNIIERDEVWRSRCSRLGGIMLGSCTDLHIFDAGSVNGTRYCNEILLPYVRLFRGAMGLQFLFMDDNAPCHLTVAAKQLLESEDIERMDWPARYPDLNPPSMYGISRQTLGNSYLTTSNDLGASIGAARRMGSNVSTTH
ncbi:transposable element Tcb2 transposase [Trichonephila clavipes]|nr:transposable element Tcb2 transposase [Trichonephila clavipes]